MRAKKVRAARRAFREQFGRAPASAAFGGAVTKFVDKIPAKGEPDPVVRATLFEKVIVPSEWRKWKRTTKS